MSDFSKEYYAAKEVARLDLYTPQFSNSLRSMERFAHPRLDYATSRMRAILKTMLQNPTRWNDSRLMGMLDQEVV